ncbi:MAG: helix-turn-helix domain-containing protein [Sphingobacterium composti]
MKIMQLNVNNVDVGKMLKEFRIKAGMTQEDIANHLFLPQTSISKMENGNRTIMFDEFLKWITVTKQNKVAVEQLFGKEVAEQALKQFKDLGLIKEETDDE